eukprot:3668704-Rhodomonas_salina.2
MDGGAGGAGEAEAGSIPRCEIKRIRPRSQQLCTYLAPLRIRDAMSGTGVAAYASTSPQY